MNPAVSFATWEKVRDARKRSSSLPATRSRRIRKRSRVKPPVFSEYPERPRGDCTRRRQACARLEVLAAVRRDPTFGRVLSKFRIQRRRERQRCLPPAEKTACVRQLQGRGGLEVGGATGRTRSRTRRAGLRLGRRRIGQRHVRPTRAGNTAGTFGSPHLADFLREQENLSPIFA